MSNMLEWMSEVLENKLFICSFIYAVNGITDLLQGDRTMNKRLFYLHHTQLI